MSEPVQVRRMRTSDMPAILRLERACFRKDAYDRNLFAAYAERCGALFLVAVDGVGVHGYILACRSRSGNAELVSIAVDSAARRRGFASAMLDAVLRRLKRGGAERLRLMVRVTNWRAIRFYRKYGFTIARRVSGYYEDGRDGWLMEKHLR